MMRTLVCHLSAGLFSLTMFGTVQADARTAPPANPGPAATVARTSVDAALSTQSSASIGEENLFIAANGFNLAATITKPANGPARAPAVVIVSASGPEDRDFTSFGVAVARQLAAALAAKGNFVVRYDGRGVGRSGGRTENAGIDEYADDALQVVGWLRHRKDVDGDRIVLLGYANAGPIALDAAVHSGDVKGIALIDAPGVSGRDLTLDQQQRVLAALKTPEGERGTQLELERRVIDAATGHGTWDGISADVKRSADTPWFKSWLLFDPAVPIKKLGQPLLVVEGSLDTVMPPAYADRLEQLSRAREKKPGTLTRKVVVPAVNHLLVRAKTGQQDEYASLDHTIVPEVPDAVAAWLKDIFTPR